jgi:hypothetical protein
LLYSQLDWILDSDTRLSRIATIWQRIASNPTLTTAQQQEATDLAALAQQQAATMQQWMNSLNNALASFQAAQHPSLLPNDYWWQRWLNTQFDIRPLANKSERERMALADTMATTLALLQQGKLPEAAAWTAMVGQLGISSSKLPASLSPFIAQNAHLRAMARQWQEVQS